MVFQAGCGRISHGCGIKAGKDGFKFQPLHVLVCLRRVKIVNPGVLIIKFHRAVRTDGSQFLAHLCHVIMFPKGFLCPGRLDFFQMGIGILNAPIGSNQTGGCFFTNGRDARYIIGGISHQSLYINKFSGSHLIFPLYILWIIILDLGSSPAGFWDAYFNVFI